MNKLKDVQIGKLCLLGSASWWAFKFQNREEGILFIPNSIYEISFLRAESNSES